MKNYLWQNDLPSDFIANDDLAIDTEAMGLNLNRDRLCVVQLSLGDEIAHVVHFDGTNYDAPNLKKILLNNDLCKIFHFARFDVAIIKKYMNVSMENIYCTKIASRIARTYTDSHSLKDLCSELLGVRLNKQQQCSYWGCKNLTKEQINYAASDVWYLHQIRDKLNDMLYTSGRLELVKNLCNSLNVIVDADLQGFDGANLFTHMMPRS